MSRTVVIDHVDGARVPFLRGILTRSLQACGLSFEDAYGIAAKMRAELAGTAEIRSDELRKRVLVRLQPFGPEVKESYARTGRRTAPILVLQQDGHSTPFSRGAHRLLLECTGLSPGDAARIAARIHDELLMTGVTEIGEDDLRESTRTWLLDEVSEEAARNYLVWEEFQASGRPLVLLIGGAPGTGKSTIATELAHMLGISRTQPTDLLREVMRVMIPERLVPVLHRSSFLAAGAMPPTTHPDDIEANLVEGYLAQSELVSVACEAALRRALDERLSIILEGVHVHPGLLDHLPRRTDTIFVPMVFAVLKPAELRRRLRGRGKVAPGRRAKRFLENFDRIWSLQSWLLAEADRTGVPIVENDDRETAVRQVTANVIRVLAGEFAPPVS